MPQCFHSDEVGGVQIGEIQPDRTKFGAYPQQVWHLFVSEAPGHMDNGVPGLMRDIDSAVHVRSDLERATYGPAKTRDKCRNGPLAYLNVVSGSVSVLGLIGKGVGCDFGGTRENNTRPRF